MNGFEGPLRGKGHGRWADFLEPLHAIADRIYADLSEQDVEIAFLNEGTKALPQADVDMRSPAWADGISNFVSQLLSDLLN